MTDQETEAENGAGCQWSGDIAAYVQGELPAEQQALLKKHLWACASCRKQMQVFRAVIKKMQTLPPATLSCDLAPAIMAKIPREEDSARSPAADSGVFWLRLSQIAALFLCVFGAGYLIVSSMKPAGRTVGSVAASKAPVSTGAEENGKSAAVNHALTWLELAQEPEGHWDAAKWGAKKEFTVAITALSLLALMSSDSDALAGRRGETVRRGLKFLAEQQNERGQIGPDCAGWLYNHGIAAIALLTASGREKADASWRKAADSAVQMICDAQSKSGGWGYFAGAADSVNTSVSIWQLQALVAADRAGIPDLKPRIKRGLSWLEGMVAQDGGLAYGAASDPLSDYETLTAAGALSLLVACGENVDKAQMARMTRLVRGAVAKEQKTVDYYRFYFLSDALRAADSPQSSGLLAGMTEALVVGQTQEGPLAGSWAPNDRWGPIGGRIYTTSMAVMTLARN